MHGRHAPETQNRQYAFMQKIMMLAKLWCDHAEGFESGLGALELNVGEWERASGTALADAVNYTVMMNVAPIFLGNNQQLGIYANSAALRTALLRWCEILPETLERIRPCQLETYRAQTMTGCNSLKKGQEKGKGKPTTRKEIARPTRALQTSTRARTVAELDIGLRTSGEQVEDRTTIPPVTTATRRKERVTRKAKGKAST